MPRRNSQTFAGDQGGARETAGQGIDIDGHIAFSHAVYAEEFVAFTMADMQLYQLSMEQGKRTTFAGDNDETSDDHDDESIVTRDSSEVDPTDIDHYDDVKYYGSCTACKIFEVSDHMEFREADLIICCSVDNGMM